MKSHLHELLVFALRGLKAQNLLPEDYSPLLQIERTKDPKHGDYATNIALVVAKTTQQKSRMVAELILQAIPASDSLSKVDIAGPGFINFYLNTTTRYEVIRHILEEKSAFGRCAFGKDRPIHIEYVSANPTGPLHVGHGRGAAYGASCAALLTAIGHPVYREYYVNDAGRQMNILATSLWLRYLELCGLSFPFPSNGYKGDYLVDIAKNLKAQYVDQFVVAQDAIFRDLPEDESENHPGGDKELYIDALIVRAKTLLGSTAYDQIHQFGLNAILQDIKNDLSEFGVVYDQWFSENKLVHSFAVESSIEILRSRNTTYEKDGALWFRATQFGDEKDRVLIRENGQITYFASDVAYHRNKLERGFDLMIDVLGADHHGYVTRIRAAMQALGYPSGMLEAPLVQFAILYRHGERVQMSTRSGQFVTLRQLREEVGNDAARFFYILRKSDQHLDFDLDLAKSKSNENPVYYIQYAHARICSVFRQVSTHQSIAFNKTEGLQFLDRLTAETEQTLLSQLSHYPEIIFTAATKREPHQLAHYLREVANAFHSYYNALSFLVEDQKLRNARLCLIAATRQIIANGLELLGVSTPEQM